MKALLESLAGRAVVIHGTGEHTRQLKDVIVNAPVRIVAFADDDRGKHGTRLWDWPVISPREAGRRGATDVVISSWMHQEAVWGRRGVYEGMGLRVWRVY
jgi:FlaA1/EpsC-like NDP-sugar epimerase